MSPDIPAPTNLEDHKALGLERAETMLKGIIIPPRPAALLAALEEQRKPEPDLNRIARVISADVALSAGTIKVVNSPFFGLRTKVMSIYHAVSLLGVTNIVNVITGLMLHSAFKGHTGRFMDEFWTRSNRLALISAHIARKFTTSPPDEAYTIGLFLDCGVPLLAGKFPEYARIYSEAINQVDSPTALYEDSLLGTDHTAVGYLIARSWQLPPAFCQCILRHHDAREYTDGNPAGEALRHIAVAMLADHTAGLLDGLPASKEWQVAGPQFRTLLGVTEEDLHETAAEVDGMMVEHEL